MPELFVLGAPRCATTWIHHILARVGVDDGGVKEHHFFDQVDEPNKSSFDEYNQRFNRDALSVDCTPTYLYSEAAIKRITASCRRPKAIVVLREPVSRAVSHFRWKVTAAREPLDLIAAFSAESSRIEQGWDPSFHYLQLGNYIPQLERLVRLWADPEDLLILEYDALKRQPRSTADSILTFAELPGPVPLAPPLNSSRRKSASVGTYVSRRIARSRRVPNWAARAMVRERETPVPTFSDEELGFLSEQHRLRVSEYEQLALQFGIMVDAWDRLAL